jgi:hypothetical protein
VYIYCATYDSNSGYNVASFSIDGNNLAQIGELGVSRETDVISESGNLVDFTWSTDSEERAKRIEEVTYNLTESCSSLFGETWSTVMRNSLSRGIVLSKALKGVEVSSLMMNIRYFVVACGIVIYVVHTKEKFDVRNTFVRHIPQNLITNKKPTFHQSIYHKRREVKPLRPPQLLYSIHTMRWISKNLTS